MDPSEPTLEEQWQELWELWDEVKDKWRRRLMYLPNLLDRGYCRLERFISWFPIIWKDHDWDHYYLYYMLRHKLRRMRKNHEEKRIIADWERVANEIMVAENLLDRLIEDNYLFQEYEDMRKKYPERDFIKTEDGHYKMTPMGPEQTKKTRAISKRMVDMRNQDLDFLFKHMRKHIEGWWD
jgi:hypothetical protein